MNNQATPLRILVVDDHVSTREEVCALIRRENDMRIVAEAGTGEEAVGVVGTVQPDVVVMDIALPGMTGVEATEDIMRQVPTAHVVALSNHGGRKLVQAVLDAGGLGYVRKEHAFEELLPAIRSVAKGEKYLDRDLDV